uniref:Reverse transcriptase domain-containing protein n=1 Tax=Hordeum vulgare subsp. vulgare TaxID=112509 RepID=A0A8I6YTB5_HORVV
MATFTSFYNLSRGDITKLNTALIILLPKKDGASTIQDYRPISLIHSMAKLISKVLSTRLSMVISTIISPAQSAFLRSKSTQDSFLYVQNIVRSLHRKKQPALLLKIDIAKAFNSVSWEYLLEEMQQLRFPARWRDWVSMLLCTASSAVLLNGATGCYFTHQRGLRQGDSLSPLLFIIAIDTLHRLLEKATELQAIAPLPGRGIPLRVSLYADDAVIFANPAAEEIIALMAILRDFGRASGLLINPCKSTVAPIRCNGVDLHHILAAFGGKVVE